jgi:hypothetical protein
MLAKLRADYVPYMLAKVDYFEQQSVALLGYNLPQILLMHANELNADCYGALLDGLRARGYAFIDLDTAMQDPAYQRADAYTGKWGPSWIHRWAIGEGKAEGVLRRRAEGAAVGAGLRGDRVRVATAQAAPLRVAARTEYISPSARASVAVSASSPSRSGRPSEKPQGARPASWRRRSTTSARRAHRRRPAAARIRRRPGAPPQSLGPMRVEETAELDQHLVALVVALAVVDLLEMVQVDADRRPAVCRCADSKARAGAVEAAGQRRRACSAPAARAPPAPAR